MYAKTAGTLAKVVVVLYRGKSRLTFTASTFARSMTRSRHRRYFEKESKTLFAVKKMSERSLSDYEDLLTIEAVALKVANSCRVPRVIQYVEEARCGNDACLVLE